MNDGDDTDEERLRVSFPVYSSGSILSSGRSARRCRAETLRASRRAAPSTRKGGGHAGGDWPPPPTPEHVAKPRSGGGDKSIAGVSGKLDALIRAALLRAQELLYFFESDLSVLISINGLEKPRVDCLHFL